MKTFDSEIFLLSSGEVPSKHFSKKIIFYSGNLRPVLYVEFRSHRMQFKQSIMKLNEVYHLIIYCLNCFDATKIRRIKQTPLWRCAKFPNDEALTGFYSLTQEGYRDLFQEVGLFNNVVVEGAICPCRCKSFEEFKRWLKVSSLIKTLTIIRCFLRSFLSQKMMGKSILNYHPFPSQR